VLPLDLLVGDAVVVGDSAPGGLAQLIEDLARRGEGEAAFPAQGAGHVLDDLPVFARVPRAIHGLPDPDDAALEARHRAFVLLVERARQHHIGELGRLAHEEVDRHVELQLRQHAPHEGVVRQRHRGIEANGEKAPDLTRLDPAEDLVGVHARRGELFRGDPPDRRHLGAVARVAEVPGPRELIALLSVLAAALAVALAGDGRVPAVPAPDPAGGEHQVDGAEHVLHAVAVVLDAARVHEIAGARRPPPFRGLADRLLGNAGDLGRARGGPLAHRRGHLLEAHRVILDEPVVQPVVLDHEVENAVAEGDVPAGLDRKEQVAGAGDRCNARIDHDDPRAVLPRLPDVVGRDGGALRDVGAADPDDLRADQVRGRVAAAIDAERLLVPDPGADHAEAAVVVDVRGLEAHVGELAHQVRLLVREARPAEDGKGMRSESVLDALDLRGNPADGGVVLDAPESSRGGLVPFLRPQEPVGMAALQVALHPLGTELPLVEGEVVPGFKSDHLVVLDLQPDPALLAAEAAVRVHHLVRLRAGIQRRPARAVQARAESFHEGSVLCRGIRHCLLLRSTARLLREAVVATWYRGHFRRPGRERAYPANSHLGPVHGWKFRASSSPSGPSPVSALT